MRKLCTGFCSGMPLALLLVGCATDDVYRADQLIKVDHPAYTAELVRPETARFSDRNARFVEGGWLVSLTPKATGESIFYDRSVIPGHHARGLPVEFLNGQPLGGKRHLRPGVGVVTRKPGKGPFRDRVREHFPWYSEVTTDDTGTMVRFYQFAPRFYFYTRTVRFPNGSKLIEFEDEMTNLGLTTLSSRVYFHPFFKAPEGVEPWCRLDTTPDFARPERPPLPGNGPAFFTTAPVPAGTSWFVCGAGESPLAALRVEGAQEVGYWRQRSPGVHVFAVEPFVDIVVPPATSRTWTWGLQVP